MTAIEDRRMLAVNLDTVTRRFDHEDSAIVVNFDSDGAPEAFFPFQTMGDFPGIPKLRIRVQAVLAPFGN